jgi:acyl carrier protein
VTPPSPPESAAIRAFITRHFYVVDPTALGDDTSLMEEGIVDSTGMLDLILFIEREFGLTVDDSALVPQNLDSIGRIAAFVARKQAAKAG